MRSERGRESGAVTSMARFPRVGSLRWRLAIAYALVLAVALGMVLAIAGAMVERALIVNTANRLEIEAGLITTGTGGRRGPTASDLAAGELAAVLGGQETAVVVLASDGTTLASESNGAPAAVERARLDPATYTNVLASGESTDGIVTAGSDSGRVLVVAVPVQLRTTGGPPTDRGRPTDKGLPPGLQKQNRGQGGDAAATSDSAPNAVAQLAVSLDPVDATLADLRARMLLIGVGILAAALAAAWIVTALSLRPLRRVAEVADQVAAGDLSARAHLPAGADEIGRLGRAFDGMVERVESTLRSQRQFAADASHELRSPLTVLGGFVDVLGRSALAESDEGARTLTAMRREIDRLSRLATDLLLLSQLEAGGGNLVPRPMDLGELVEDIGHAAQVLARGRRVVVERDGPLPIVADRDRLTQALMNLIDNAVRHTPGNGLISLTSRRDGQTAVAVVANEGEPIDAQHLAYLFERFYRVPLAEGSERPGDHAGLGLPIVKAIAEASGGTADVSSDATATRFHLRLPLVED
jgi:two-component system, OmpR family, sensor kinase